MKELPSSIRRRPQPSPASSVQVRTQLDAGATPPGFDYPWRRLAIGMVVMALVAVLASGVGTVGIPPLTTLKILASRLPGVDIVADWPSTSETILLQLRLPRVVLAAVVGGALAISGATYQGLFRNPLADPYLIGVASGAGLGATIVLLTGVPRVLPRDQSATDRGLHRRDRRRCRSVRHREKLRRAAPHHPNPLRA